MTGYEVIAFYSLLIGIPIVVIYVAVRGITKRGKLSKLKICQIILEGCLIQYMITLLAVTLWPTMGFRQSHIINLMPLIELYDALIGNNLLNPTYVLKVWCYNVCMFVPLGLLGVLYLRLCEKKQKRILAFGFCLILLIESVQYFFINGRAADINDVITNMVGVLVGYLIGKLLLEKFLEDMLYRLNSV